MVAIARYTKTNEKAFYTQKNPKNLQRERLITHRTPLSGFKQTNQAGYESVKHPYWTNILSGPVALLFPKAQFITPSGHLLHFAASFKSRS